MNRPVLGTISILALLGGGLYFAWNYKDKPLSEPVRKSYEDAAARSAIQSWLELPLPNSATAIHCAVENLEHTKLVFACFDVPPVELPGLFDQQVRFPSSVELVTNPDVLRLMSALTDPQRPWWQMEQLPNPRCAQKSGNRNVAPAVLKWRVQVCAAPLSDSSTRVFIAFSEEPMEAK